MARGEREGSAEEMKGKEERRREKKEEEEEGVGSEDAHATHGACDKSCM